MFRFAKKLSLVTRSKTNLIDNKSKTKILCTLGPASESKEVLEDMMEIGMDAVRFNFSHGSHESHIERFKLIRETATRLSKQISILCDIQGPKIRVGEMENPVTLVKDQIINVTSDDCVGNEKRFHISYPLLAQDLVKDDRIFINDGIVELIVIGKENNDLICLVITGGIVSDRKGCNLPSGNLAIDVLTEKDKVDLKLIAKLNPEFIAASFVGKAEDVFKIRNYLKSVGNDKIKIISKIERPAAVENIDGIIHASDGIMVARGDLGVEIPVHKVPRIQKEIVKKANKLGVYSIIATQMLESMTTNSRPTRAETNDVYNAVLDGADAVMLSGETSVGFDPVNVVRTMDEIVFEAEKNIPRIHSHEYDSNRGYLIETFGHLCFTLSKLFARNNWKGKIIIFTKSGYTASMVSKFRPPLDLIILTSSDRVVNETSLLWGVRAMKIKTLESHDEQFKLDAIKECHESGLFDSDDTHVGMISSSIYQPDMGHALSIYDLKKVKNHEKYKK
eukprot:gene9776-2102_t